MERVSECIKINRFFCWNSYIVGGGSQCFDIRTRFDSKWGSVVVIFTYTNLYICVWWLVHIGFPSRNGVVLHSAVVESTRHVLWLLTCTGPSHARRGHISRTDTMRGTYWHVAAEC
jgi:hypothetical protein